MLSGSILRSSQVAKEGEGEADNAQGEQKLEEELGMFYDDLEEEEEH